MMSDDGGSHIWLQQLVEIGLLSTPCCCALLWCAACTVTTAVLWSVERHGGGYSPLAVGEWEGELLLR